MRIDKSVPLSADVRSVLAQHPQPAKLIAGVRPESFEDASLGADGRTSFEVDAELVESLGADKYVHFRAATAQADQLAELVEESGPSENLFVARISADSTATTGSKVRLVIDTAKLVLFDAETGANVSIPPVA